MLTIAKVKLDRTNSAHHRARCASSIRSSINASAPEAFAPDETPGFFGNWGGGATVAMGGCPANEKEETSLVYARSCRRHLRDRCDCSLVSIQGNYGEIAPPYQAGELQRVGIPDRLTCIGSNAIQPASLSLNRIGGLRAAPRLADAMINYPSFTSLILSIDNSNEIRISLGGVARTHS